MGMHMGEDRASPPPSWVHKGSSMSLRPIVALTLIFPLLLTSCATILRGEKQEIHFESDVPGTEVIVNGKSIGPPPVSADFMRRNEYTVAFEKNHRPLKQTRMVGTAGFGWFIADFIFGGIIGLAIDGITGNWNSFEPSVVRCCGTPSDGVAKKEAAGKKIK